MLFAEAEFGHSRLVWSDRFRIMLYPNNEYISLWYDGTWTGSRERHVPRAMRAWLGFPIDACTANVSTDCACWDIELSAKGPQQ